MSKKEEPSASNSTSSVPSSTSTSNHQQASSTREESAPNDRNSNEGETSKLSKRIVSSMCKSKLKNNSITSKLNDLFDGNGASTSSSSPQSYDSFVIIGSPGSSPPTQINIGGAQESKQSSPLLNSLPTVDNLSVCDQLTHLDVNKCNITDDSEDDSSASKTPTLSGGSVLLDKSIRPRFSSITRNDFSSSSPPVNQTPQSSSAINSGDQLNKSLTNFSLMTKSIRNSIISNSVPLRNTCAVHRGSMSSHDLMNVPESSNYVPSHRLLHSSSSSSYNSSPSHCCHFRHHHYESHRADSMIPVSSFRQQPCLANQKSPFDLGMSSIEASTIISNHCNTENNTNAFNSTAITKLTSSSTSAFPVTALTIMESPNLSLRNGSYNWQAFMSTLKDRMATIFNCELLADVHFVVGKGNTQTRFPAHKFVLSIGSAVFDAMFNGPLTKAAMQNVDRSKHTTDSGFDSMTNTDTEIELPDVEPEAFQALLRFLYLDEVQIGPETVMTTLYAAKKYEVPALEMACVDFLKANLNADNAFMMLTQARLFDEATLADLCLETIDKHTMDSLFSDSFFDIDLETLKLVLNRDSLRVREVSLFAAALRWTECECERRLLELNSENKRKVLGDAVNLIRFPLMNIEEFAQNVAQCGLLTDREVVDLFCYFTVASKPAIRFSIEPRCTIVGEEYSVNRFQRTESRWGYSGTSDRIRFLTDRPIFVIGFGLFGSIHGPCEYEAIIEVIHTGSSKPIASNTTTFVSDGSDSTFRVLFNSPVEIMQNTNYTACATIKGVDSWYGTNGYRTVTCNLGKGDPKETVCFQFSYAAGCNNGTSVEDGQIPEILFYT